MTVPNLANNNRANNVTLASPSSSPIPTPQRYGGRIGVEYQQREPGAIVIDFSVH